MNEDKNGVDTNVPVLLLKTKSTPSDGYEERFLAAKDYAIFKPIFVPVLEHKFPENGLQTVRHHLQHKDFGKGLEAKYGGLIFTSQRAVEAFAKLVKEGSKDDNGGWPHLQDIPIYTVGPATSRALRAISQTPPLNIFGEEAGNGEALAHYILDHRGQWYQDCKIKPPLLFLVGEQRRDIIPKALMDPALGEDKRVQVDELVVYGTGVMESFGQDFARELQETEKKKMRWVVVFSPTGCDAMLRALGLLDVEAGKVQRLSDRSGERKTYIATIGPTTRDFLKNTFDYDPDVCAEKPSPEGVEEGIKRFMDQIRKAGSE